MDYQVLKKVNGDVFFEVSRMPDNSFIYANWIGIQSLETVVMGGNHVLSMQRKMPCAGFLNSNRELIGSWEVAVQWMAYKWAPAAKALGIKYFAHVLSPGIYGQRSFQLLQEHLKVHFRVRSFDDEELAQDWLKTYLG